MSAVPRKRPAVVERPFYLHIRVFFDPVEQHFYIDIVAVQVVQPEQVGLVLFSPLQKLPGRSFGAKSVGIEQAGLESMELNLKV